jgi:hypothetical protein
MAEKSDVLKGLSEDAIAELQKALEDRGRRKIDWTNMTHEERQQYNKTTTPVTPMVPFQPYPRSIYGIVNGQVTRVPYLANAKEEDELRAKYPDGRWTSNLMDFGIETCPSKPMGTNAAAFEVVGAEKPPINPNVDVVNNPAPVVNIPTYAEQMHPLAKKRSAEAIAKQKATLAAKRAAA